MINLLAGSNTNTKTANPATPSGRLNLLAGLNATKTPTPLTPRTPSVPSTNAKPPGVTSGFTMPNGHEAYKTTSGTTWEYLPDGTRVVYLAPQFGGGAYSVNPKDTNQVINSGHTSYGGESAQSGFERDDIIPVSLGGNNASPTNIRTEPLIKGGGTATDPLEKKLAADVKAGRITLAQARLQIMTAKAPQTSPQPSTSVKGNLLEGAGSALKTVGNTALQLPKSGIDMFAKPSDTEQQIEKKIVPTPTNPVQKVLTAVPRTLAKGVVRGLEPQVEGLGKEIGTFASNPHDPANLPQNDLQSFLNAANFGVSVGGTIKVVGEEAGTNLANKSTTLKITPEELSAKLNKGEIKNPQAVAIAQELVKRNQSLEVTGTEPTGGLKEKIGTAIGGEVKPPNPQFKLGDNPNSVAAIKPEDFPAKTNPNSIAAVKPEDFPTKKSYTDKTTPSDVIKGFNQSTNQKSIATVGKTKFELGTFGENQISKKASQPDRFPSAELQDTLSHITNSFKASNDPANYRSDNIAWVAEMPNGEKRVIYTRQNASGAEEIINWHKIDETKNPNYLSTLESYGSPAGTRTQIDDLEGRSPVQLKDKTNTNITQSEPSVNKENAFKNQEGSVPNPAPIIKDFIDQTKQGTKASSDLSDNLYKLQQNAQADKLIASQTLKKLNVSPKDAEAIYHYEEDKTLPLTDTQKQIYEAYVKPLAIESQKIAEKLKPTGLLTSDTYTPRYVKGKGGVMDRLTETAKGVKNVGGKNGLLNKTAASTKHRTMKVVVDDQGNRTVVSIKKGRVTGFDNKVATDLGILKLKSNADLLEKDVKPIQKKLETLQKYIDGISKIKVSSPVSQAKLTNAQTALSGIMEQAYGVSDSTGSGLTKELKARANVLIKEIKTLESIKPGEKLTNISGRIKAIQKKMVELSNAMAEIESKYNPDELNNKKFVAKGGKTYTIKEATTKEIEANTDLTYHKNVIANRITNYLDLRNKERAVDFLDKLKESPEFNNIAKKFDEGIAPTGWRPTKLQNFAGYNFEPHVAATLDKFAGDLTAGKRNIVTKINNFMRTAIFFNPLIHIPNITVHWAVNRGVTPFLNPLQYPKFISSTTRAINAVIHQNADYVNMLRSGAPLVYGNENVKQLTDLLIQKIGNDLEDPQYAKVKQLFKNYNLYSLSGKATWLVNDVMTMQAIYEEMDNGATMDSAIHEVGKHIPNYRVPATILNSEALAKALANPNLTMFGAYHYGALRSYYEMAKDLISPAKFKEVEPNTFEEQTTGQRTKTRLKTIDKLMMMALIGLVIYPALDKLAQKLTGNKASKVGRAGALTFPYNTYKLATGQMQWIDYLSSIVTPAVGTREALQLATNRDLRTGQNIVTSPVPKQAAKEIGSDLVKTIAPLDKATQIKSGKLSLKDFALSLFRITNPSSSPATKQAQSMIYDERPNLSKQIKSLYLDNKKSEADALIKDYNDRLLIYFQQATRDAGEQMSDDQIKKNASEYFLKAPSAKTLKNATDNQDKSSLDKLLTPPKAKPF